MAQYNIIAENENYTIVSDYQSAYRTDDKYQTEAQLERELIKTCVIVCSGTKGYFPLYAAI